MVTLLLLLGITPPEKPPLPEWLVLVPEMKAFPELQLGKPCAPSAFADQTTQAQTALKKKLPEMHKQLTPEVVRSLSRWAQRQMTGYVRVPTWDRVVWKPMRQDATTGQLVLEGTLDTLPTHSALVTRWLKGYVVYDPAKKDIVRVIITIRGERME